MMIVVMCYATEWLMVPDLPDSIVLLSELYTKPGLGEGVGGEGHHHFTMLLQHGVGLLDSIEAEIHMTK